MSSSSAKQHITPLTGPCCSISWAAAQRDLSPKQWSAVYMTSLGQVFPGHSSKMATESIAAGNDVCRNAASVQLALGGDLSLAGQSGLFSFATSCPYFIPSAVSPSCLRLADSALRAPTPTTLASAVQAGRAAGLTCKAVMASRTPCIRILLHTETSAVISNVSLVYIRLCCALSTVTSTY